MKFHIIIQTFMEHMSGANLPLLMFIGFFGLLALSLALYRWGAGILMASTFVLIGLQMVSSEVISGIALIGRFVLVIVLVIYTVISGRNRINFSPTAGVLFLLPVVMLLNSARLDSSSDALLQSLLCFFFYIGLILGGQRIFGDAKGRMVFVKTLILFTVVMVCLQVPYLSSTYGKFQGTFEGTIGPQIIGMNGAIVLFWFAMRKPFGSFWFLSNMIAAVFTFVVLLFSGGRTAMGGTLLGLLAVLSRKLRRNLVIFLALFIILAPIGFRIVVSLPAFEYVRLKFSSLQSSGRIEKYQIAWQEAKAKPLFGWGTGSSLIIGNLLTGGHFHNSYLEFAVEHGIPFAVVMLFLFLWLPFRGMLLMRNCQVEEMKDMANLSTALLVSHVFSSFLGGTLLMTMGILPTYAAIALQEGIRNENKEINNSLLEQYGGENYCLGDFNERLPEQSLGFYEAN